MDAVLPIGSRVYIGGNFTYVGPYTGSGVSLSAATGSPVRRFGKVDGFVDAAVSDGAGGYYVASSVDVPGVQVGAHLAHVRADGSIDRAWNPAPNSTVSALAVSGSTVYVGGAFTRIDGQLRSRIAALDARTGAATAWNPDVSGVGDFRSAVYALAVSGSTVYVGGDFARVGGAPRHNIAAVDAVTGVTSGWNPSAGPGAVYALVVAGSTVYVGGDFNFIGQQERNYIGAIDASSGAATAWNPDASDIVQALAVSGSTLYAGGAFSEIGGRRRHNLAALNATTGTATAFNPRAESYVQALAVSDSTVYAGGAFKRIGGRERNYVAALDARTGAATSWNPNAGDWVGALAVSGSTVYAGGDFTSIGGVSRGHIAALDARTGVPTAWNPNADDTVNALAASGSTVYVAGHFTSIGGRDRNYIAALNARTGVATAWNPNASLWVGALAVSGPFVYAGGPFDSIGGRSVTGLAQLDARTGAAASWNAHSHWASTGGHVDAIVPAGSILYVAGLFDHIGGQARTSIAALNSTTGTATEWNPNPRYLNLDGYVGALALLGSNVYVGGQFTRIGGQARNYIASIDTTTGAATAWDPHARCSPVQLKDYACGVSALTISGARVYAGGTFISIGSRVRHGIAALDASSGLATRWDPQAASYIDTGPEVHALAALSSHLYVGGDFNSFGDEHHQGFGAFHQTPASTPPPPQVTG